MKLIINADDFGLSESITDGIIIGIKEKFISSTSVMINMPFAKYAIEQAIKNKICCVGLHINLTVGKPILPNKNLTDECGVFLYNQKQINNQLLTYQDVYNELLAQMEKFNEFSGGGVLKIDHLDCHHQILKNTHIRKAVFDIARKYNLPLRNETGSTVPDKKCYSQIKTPDFLEKDFTIQNVTIEKLKSIILKYQGQDVIVEIMTHPGLIDDYTKTITSYLDREKELKVLKQAKEDGIFDSVEMISFKDL